jgi:Mn2+/Fe2+ NRAMP family transporter
VYGCDKFSSFLAAGCLVVSCSAFLLLLLERRGARWLESVFGLVIGLEAVAMAVNFFRAGVPAKQVALGECCRSGLIGW